MARNRSPNAPRLFPPALHPNRDAFKNVCLFRCLPKIGGAAVEEGSAAIDANRDTRRRRSCTGWREGLSGLGRTLVGRRCTRDCGPWILNLSFAAACSNNRDAGQTGLLHPRLLLTQHLLARAARELRRCSDFHQTGNSKRSPIGRSRVPRSLIRGVSGDEQ